MAVSTLFRNPVPLYRQFAVSLLSLILLALPLNGNATENKLDRLLERSGTVTQINDWPEVTKAGFAQGLRDSGRFPEAVITQMLASADEHLDPESILGDVRKALAGSLNEDSLDFLLAWYDSDNGKRVTDAEKASSTAQAYERFLVQIPLLLQDRGRVASARRIDKLVSATDMAMEMQSYTGVAVYSAMMTAMAPDKPLDLQAYREATRAMQPEMRKKTEQFVLASLVYSYLEVDVDSLLAYENFLAHPTTRRFNMRAFEGLANGTQRVMADWSYDIADILREHMASPGQ